MKANVFFKIITNALAIFLVFSSSLCAQTEFTEYSGKVVDSKSNEGIEAASLSISETNISTITNSDGEFVLKVPSSYLNSQVFISLLGYKSKTIAIAQLSKDSRIALDRVVTKLSEVNISAFKSAENLVRKVFENRDKNHQDESVYMTAFYRETIKRRNRNVSLTEAVVEVMKYPNNASTQDAIKLNKARKSTDYRRLDTVSVKLQGGPFSTIYLDVMKYPQYIFTDETIKTYDFSFNTPSTINNRNVFVVDFKPRNSSLNLNYIGKLYIDAQSLALVSAEYAIDLSNKEKTKNLLVEKKPRNIVVYPVYANYKVDYKAKGNKWYYSYSNLNLRFKVNKKRQLFNKVYTLSSEMVVTDWEVSTTDQRIKAKDRLRPSVIITDAISGFADSDFWGVYNVIEPDKSIEFAIEKIKKSIEKEKRKESK